MFDNYYSSLYQKINLSEQLIEQTKEKMHINLAHKNSLRTPILKLCASIAILLIFSGGISVFAYNLTGGDFFQDFFAERLNFNEGVEDYSSDFSQIDDMSSDSIGTVIDTDEITIDVMGVLVSKNTASIMLQVTANQMDSVLIEGSSGGLRNYRFQDETSGNLFDNCRMVSYQYFYSNEKEGLEDNQLEILYTILKNEDMQGKQYELELGKFGSHNSNTNSHKTTFTALYHDNWKFSVDFTSESDNFSTVYMNKPVLDHKIIVKNFNITPLALRIDFIGTASNEDVFHQELEYLIDNVNLEVIFREGNVLKEEDFDSYILGASYDENKYDILIIFNAPVDVKEIVAIRLFEENYMIQYPR